jgi:hypothetical protein
VAGSAVELGRDGGWIVDPAWEACGATGPGAEAGWPAEAGRKVGDIGDPPGPSGPDAAGRGNDENPPAEGNESAEDNDSEDDEDGDDDSDEDDDEGPDAGGEDAAAADGDEEPETAGSNVVSSAGPGLTFAAPRAPDRRGPITRAARLKTLRVPFS